MPVCCATNKLAFCIICDAVPGCHVATVHCAGNIVNICIFACCCCRNAALHRLLQPWRLAGPSLPFHYLDSVSAGSLCLQHGLVGAKEVLSGCADKLLSGNVHRSSDRHATATGPFSCANSLDFPPLVFQLRVLLGFKKAGCRKQARRIWVGAFDAKAIRKIRNADILYVEYSAHRIVCGNRWYPAVNPHD